MKHSLNREELIEQLKELAAQKLPTYLANHMGAMCYEPSMIDSLHNMPTLPSSIDLSSFPQ